MNIAICDDDAHFVNRFQADIVAAFADSVYANVSFQYFRFTDSVQLKNHLLNPTSPPIDILFLDISMPHLDGFDIAAICGRQKSKPLILFITNYEEHVFFSFRFSPFRFLCKRNYREHLPEALCAAVKKQSENQGIIKVHTEREIRLIPQSSVLYVQKECRTNYILVVCPSEKYRLRSNIKEFCSEYEAYPWFSRVSSSTLVNLAHVHFIKGNALVLDSGQKLIISRTMKKSFLHDYYEFMRGV